MNKRTLYLQEKPLFYDHSRKVIQCKQNVYAGISFTYYYFLSFIVTGRVIPQINTWIEIFNAKFPFNSGICSPRFDFIERFFCILLFKHDINTRIQKFLHRYDITGCAVASFLQFIIFTVIEVSFHIQ